MADILRKRLDRLERLFAPRAVPVCVQLVAVEPSPLGHEGMRTVRERPGDQLTVEVD